MLSICCVAKLGRGAASSPNFLVRFLGHPRLACCS